MQISATSAMPLAGSLQAHRKAHLSPTRCDISKFYSKVLTRSFRSILMRCGLIRETGYPDH